MKPLIGVTTSRDLTGLVQSLAIRMCLFVCGAKTTLISPDKSHIKANELDGLLISGGTDLYPHLYQNSDLKQGYRYNHARDKLELELLKGAKKYKLPIFCICRGAQLLNIFKGGTLHTDISKVFENAKYPNSFFAKVFFRKKINIKRDTRLDEIFKTQESEVNSLHSQAIDKLGNELEVSAEEDNGVVQAIEGTSKRFIIGVQFHPEFLFYRKEIRTLFSEFVQACSEAKRK